jgi:hypothetical protein
MSSTPTLTRILFFGAACLTVASCTPRINYFAVDAHTIGPNDTVHVQWAARGKVFLKVQDYPYTGSAGTGAGAGKDSIKPADLTLLFTRDGKTTPVILRANSGIQLPLPARDSLTIHKQPDSNSTNVLRYLVLAASMQGKEVDSVIPIEIRMDSSAAQIAFAPVIIGDSLVAAGVNDTTRWGDVFSILTVAARSTRSLTVTHAGITRVLNPAQEPDTSFSGTPVKGDWAFNSAMTQEEKDDHSLIPRFLRITITIKHR